MQISLSQSLQESFSDSQEILIMKKIHLLKEKILINYQNKI